MKTASEMTYTVEWGVKLYSIHPSCSVYLMLSTLYKFYVDLVLCGIIADVLRITLLVKSVSLSSTGALKQVVHSMAIVVAGR